MEQHAAADDPREDTSALEASSTSSRKFKMELSRSSCSRKGRERGTEMRRRRRQEDKKKKKKNEKKNEKKKKKRKAKENKKKL